MANDFDRAARHAAKFDPPGFLRWLFPALGGGLSFARWFDTRTIPFPGEPDRTCDTVAELLDAVEAWLAVVEFQSEPDANMFGRLLEFLARLWIENRRRYSVAAALLNLTGPVQPSELKMHLPGTGSRLELSVHQRTMREEDAAATLAGIASGAVARCILAWIPLMRGADDAGIIQQWRQLADAESDEKKKVAYGLLALTFAELAGRTAEWRQGLQGWNMQKSVLWEEIRLAARVETRRDDVLQVLRLRFTDPVPTDVLGALQNVSALPEVDRLFTVAVTAPTLDDFRAALPTP